MITRYLHMDACDIEETPRIYYCDGYKNQLREVAIFKTSIRPGRDIVTELVILRKDGLLIVGRYFAWDGCTRPAINTRTNARGGLAHDACYYLMRIGLLDIRWRPAADNLLHDLMERDGAWSFRADYYRWAVDRFAGKYARPENARKILVAP